MGNGKDFISNSKKVDQSKFHLLEPDYSRAVYEIPRRIRSIIIDRLAFLYGRDEAITTFDAIYRILKVYYAFKSSTMIDWEKGFNPKERFTEKDMMLITYGDLFINDNEPPLVTLNFLAHKYLKARERWTIIHILPFFPYSSDRGFAVLDFEEVDPNLGTWDDINKLKTDFKLMFDGVFNHVSSKSKWFQEFLNQNPLFIDAFESFKSADEIPPEQLSIIRRPRTTPLLTPFDTLNGKRYVWTTFSPDQIDLNYKNPIVLSKMIEILLFYVRRGADLIRLDAVTYLWDEPGTSSASLEQTHTIVKLFRDVLDAVTPHVGIVTETNVPHEENITYFGDGRDEAQLVYNFALAPLVLITFYTGNSSRLTRWAASLKNISDTSTFLNFLDSHDGVGVQGAKHILSAEEIELLEKKALEHGGLISYKSEADGSQSPYELNITWWNAINRDDINESEELQIRRYQASRNIALTMIGVPAFYVHGLLATKNDRSGVSRSGIYRDINRKIINVKALEKTIFDDKSLTYRVVSQFGELIDKRISEKAFHPNSSQSVIDVSDAIFCLLRTSNDKSEHILTLTNVTDKTQHIVIDTKRFGLKANAWVDLLSEKHHPSPKSELSFQLEPYDILWLKAQ